jgi:hypothetical protein
MRGRVEPGDPGYMAHMLRHTGMCRRRTKGRPKRDPMSIRIFEFEGLYARLIKWTNARQKHKLKTRGDCRRLPG